MQPDNELLNSQAIATELGVSQRTVLIAIGRLGLRLQTRPDDRRFRGYPRSELPRIEAEIRKLAQGE